MKHDYHCLWTVFTRNLIFRKGSKTENIKAKDPIQIFYINEDHEDGKGKGKVFLFNVGSRRKPESLFPAEPMADIFYLPSNQSRPVLLETVLS